MTPKEGTNPSTQSAYGQDEGWTYVIGSPKWHYIREHRSICGKWLMLGNPELEQGNNESLDNCKACRRKLEQEAKKAAKNAGK